MPISPYAIGKLTIENYLHHYAHKYPIEVVAYRIANPYGPEQVTKSGFGVVPMFIDMIRSNKPITIMGDGSMTRDYIYIDDMVDMITKSYQRPKHTIYNIGTGIGVSVNSIIEEIEKVYT